MTFEQHRVADYAHEYAPQVSEHIVQAIVQSVGDTLTVDDALDALDAEQRDVDSRLRFVLREWRRIPLYLRK